MTNNNVRTEARVSRSRTPPVFPSRAFHPRRRCGKFEERIEPSQVEARFNWTNFGRISDFKCKLIDLSARPPSVPRQSRVSDMDLPHRVFHREQKHGKLRASICFNLGTRKKTHVSRFSLSCERNANVLTENLIYSWRSLIHIHGKTFIAKIAMQLLYSRNIY